MKQITYNYTTDELAKILANHEGLEGTWILNATIESTPCSIPSLVKGQMEGTFPGAILRIIGVQLVEALNGVDTDNSGPIESSETASENS
jgi:hypothetical protein